MEVQKNLFSHCQVCVDAACGTGQAAKELVQFYDTVIGIDPSKSQLENAYRHGNSKDDSI
jgi:ubiquinone/menaquinone biosynthesis C-methylase UbiE